jgi:neutral ceramidase
MTNEPRAEGFPRPDVVLVLALATATVLALAGCGTLREAPLPDPVSPPSSPAASRLRAGFGKRDITPPPGVGLSSFSIDSRQAVGFRQRLFARAIVLEDRKGERLALVVVDLGEVSLLLHREVAHRVLRAGTGIGADRLLLSATHTHSGPGNYFAADGLNANSGRFPGFDPMVAEFLIEGISGAIEDAAADLQPARAGWAFEAVWDFTFNRSFAAYERNTAPRIRVDPQMGRPPDQQAVDSTFALLRVDRCNEEWESCRPWGAFGVFAMHSSNVPASNNLFDADTHGVIARAVEAHIRESRGDRDGPAYFLLAQGAHGDVGANRKDPPPCRSYRFLPELGAAGPRTLPPAEAWRAPEGEIESCLDGVRREVDSLGWALGRKATAIFDTAGRDLSPELSLARAFRAIDLRSYEGPHPVCWPPRVGAASVGGAEKGYIRTWKHRPFFVNLSFHEGGSAARDEPEGCFGHKKVQLGILVKEYSLPQVLQLGVFQVGEVLVGTVPVEPTTEVGAAIREAILEAGPGNAARSLVVSLTNGYALYVASTEEYEAQHYEGGATLYGPNTAAMLSYELGQLSGSLREGSPVIRVDSAYAYLREGPSHFWPPRPIPPGFRRNVEGATCTLGELRVRWTDLKPGTLIPADGPILQLEESRGGEWVLRAEDGDPDVQVRALEPRGEGYLWEARWTPRRIPAGEYRFRLLGRQGLETILAPACTVPIG